MRRPISMLASVVLAFAAFGGVAGANDDPPTPAATGVVPAGDVAAAAVADVATETEYRNAITAFNADGSGPHTINLTADISITGATDPEYTNATQPLTIDGNGFVIDGGGARRILDMSTPQVLTVRNLIAANGFATGSGGAIEVSGSAIIENSIFTDNESQASGGAIDVNDDVTVVDSTFVDNTASFEGGAIDTSAAEGADVTVDGSTFVGNSTGDGGGAIAAEGLVSVLNSTFNDNSAATAGGAIQMGGQDAGEAAFVYATFSGNDAPEYANYFVGEEGPLTLVTYGTVVADPLGGGTNCGFENGATGESSYSYEQGGASCGFTGTGDTENGADPQLGALGDNGGPTATMLPATASPLVGAIPTASCEPDVTIDQRGITRPQGDGCDIGAVELEVVNPVPPLVPPESAPTDPVVITPRFTG